MVERILRLHKVTSFFKLITITQFVVVILIFYH